MSGSTTRPRTATAARSVARSERPVEVIGEGRTTTGRRGGQARRSVNARPASKADVRPTPQGYPVAHGRRAPPGGRGQLLSGRSARAPRDRVPAARSGAAGAGSKGADRPARRLRLLGRRRRLRLRASRGRTVHEGGAAGTFALRARPRAGAAGCGCDEHAPREGSRGRPSSPPERPCSRTGAFARSGAALPSGRDSAGDRCAARRGRDGARRGRGGARSELGGQGDAPGGQLRSVPLPPVRGCKDDGRGHRKRDPGPRPHHARRRLRGGSHQRLNEGGEAARDARRADRPAQLRRHGRGQAARGRVWRLCLLRERRMSCEGRYFHALPDGRIQCDVCPRYCALHEGQRGLCFVRAREGDRMVLTTYGRSRGFCVDPIEKKPLNHFLPGTSVLSFGTAGCNLGCRFCQNWDMSKSREMDVLADAATPEQIARKAQELGCRSVAFTYNDPTVFLEYAVDAAQACRERGIMAVSVTAGYICDEPRRELYRHIDAANVDLKGFTEDFYRRVCLGHLDPVLDSLRYLQRETQVWLEITTLLIPGENDTPAEVDALTRWVHRELGPDVPLHFTAFHPDFKMLDRPPTPPSTLTRAREIGLGNGLRYIYTGNVHDERGGTTHCPGCGKAVIARDWYRLTSWSLHEGRCAGCGAPIPGVFEGRPGQWGPRRLPVHVGGVVAGVRSV